MNNKKNKHMNKHCIAAAVAASFFAVPLAAMAEDEILPDAKRNGYAIVDFWYSQFDKDDLDLNGGGFRIGGEYVDPALLVGIGGRFGMGMYFGSDKNEILGNNVVSLEDPVALDLMADVYVPFRVSEFATIYGGVGITGFIESADYEATVYNKARHRYVTTSGTVETDGFPVLFAAFVGIRLRYENVFGFVEYRNDFKKDVTFKQSFDYYSIPDEKWDAERGGGRIIVGLGLEFGK